MQATIAQMRGSFDVIILDTPPVLAVSDPLIVAGYADGA
jgi:Mrp family chromosome partitioning ATPase